jgi:hypothetical protein
MAYLCFISCRLAFLLALPIKPDLHYLPVDRDPVLVRMSAWRCTPDFCQRNLHLARIRRFNLLHSAAERKQSENSAAPPIVRLCALPPSLIAALRLRCTLQTGSSASFTSRYCTQPVTHTNQQCCSAGTPNPSSWGTIRGAD